jgi:diguanylate cyclase (GGDEF)-like protein
MYSGGGEGFHSQERDLLQTYARLAAAVLDSATALDESRSLLALARALAVAGTSDEVVERLAAAVPDVVDCDRVAVFLWDDSTNELSCRAAGGHEAEMAEKLRSAVITPADTPTLQRFLDDDDPKPVLFEADTDDAYVGGLMRALGDTAVLVVPIVARGRFLGILNVAAITRPERLRPSPGLLELLQGVAAQAATAIENGRLVDGMAHQARHDALTGLANRVLFTERAEAALDRARRDKEPVALVYADLDGFKAVNDSLGHAAGDELLDQVAERLAATVRAGDTLARLGGDEFALLAPTVTRSEAEALAERAAGAFAKPFTIAGRELTVGVSVGVAVFPEDAYSLESLLTSADAAMYRAKRRSRLRAAA